ncbi:MAG: YaeQ family protein [Bdellovibrionota bacterium]|nr:MAG: YaeQ family protein [Bdellovibrionota bacterium]
MADQNFHNFHVQLSNSDCEFYGTLRLRIVTHHEESRRSVFAKVLAYCLEYSDDLRVATAPYETHAPALSAVDGTGGYLRWIDVGEVRAEKLSRALRHHRGAQFAVYFYEHAQAVRFADDLRGSTENWIEPVQFYLIDPQFVELIPEGDGKRVVWEVAIVDRGIYLTTGDAQCSGQAQPLDMWGIYQQALLPPSIKYS